MRESRGNGGRRSSHQSGDELLDILVRNESAEVVERGTGSLLDVGLGVPDGVGHGGDDLGHQASALVGRRDDELVHDLESANLDLPLSGGADLLEEDGKERGDGPGGRNLNDRLDGLDGGLTDDLLLVGEGFGDDRLHELLVEERLNGVTETLLGEDREKVEGTFTNA